MFGGKESSRGARFVIDQEVDVALAPKRDVARPVIGDMGKAHRLEYGLNEAAFGCGELDELEAAKAHWVFEQVCHVSPPGLVCAAGGRPGMAGRAAI